MRYFSSLNRMNKYLNRVGETYAIDPHIKEFEGKFCDNIVKVCSDKKGSKFSLCVVHVNFMDG